MPVFDELTNGRERMEAPEERRAETIGRSNKKALRNRRTKQTSVSEERFTATVAAIRFVVMLVVLALVAAAVYYGLNLFLEG